MKPKTKARTSRRQILHLGEARATSTLRVPVSPGQEGAIKARAHSLGLSVADYLRSLAGRDIGDDAPVPWPPALTHTEARKASGILAALATLDLDGEVSDAD